MKYRAFALFANFLLCCTLHVELAAQTVVAQSPYRFQNFDTKDGLPSAFVGSIAQDSLGFIWLQYYLGLSRFDGYNFKVYRHDPNDTIRSLPGGGIGFVLTDPKGNLWVTPHTRIQEYFPISKYDFKTDSFIKYKPRVNGTIVTDICFDKTNPVIWFATVGKGLFSFNIESLETKAYSNSHSDSTISTRRNAMWSISDRDTCILVGSSEGLWKFDKKTNTFGRPRYNTESVLLYSTSIWDIDDGPNSNHNDLWLGLSDKLLHVDADLSVLEWFDFPDGFRPKGHQRDKEGIIWLSTWDDQGLYRYNPVDNSLINIRNIPGDINSVRSNKINSIHVDKDQNIWIGSDLGVSRLQRQRLRFYNFTIAGGMGESTVYHQDKNDFAVITRTNNDSQEILIAPLIPGRFDYLRFKKITQFKRNLVCGLWQGKRNFWVSVHHQGIRGFPIDTISGMILPEPHQLLSHDPENKNTISSNLTTFVWEDRHEILWVGTRDGLNKVNLRIPYGREGSVVRYKHIDDDPNSLGNDIVWNVYPEDENAFWVITDTGADLFRNGHFEHFYEGDTAPTLYKTGNGMLYVAALGALFEGRKHGSRYRFSQRPILKIDDVIRMQGDSLGRVWISNAQGIICFDPKQNIAIGFNETNGFDHTYAIQPWYREYQSTSGVMVISDPTGISLFNPLSLTIDTARTFPVLTGLKINNHDYVVETKARAGGFSTNQAINALKELVLDYQDNNFAIEFSAMEMISPDKNRYRYKLEGYDDEWIETDSKTRIATYTNMDAGVFVFKVRASNHHGIWSDQEKTLVIRILPPPWKTWWAYTLYGLAFVSILFVWRKYDIKRVKLKNRAEHLTELDNLKTRFFANISHEFRTPITLILGPLKEMYQGKFKGDQTSTMGIMLRNGQRLLGLINQLLDLSKIEAGKLKLHASPTDLVEFLREIVSSYESLAADKKIKYFFYPEVEILIAYIDAEKMEKVIHNVLSNAFKFTKPGGEIILYLKIDKNQCVITVKDTGIGIPTEQLNKVFDRFYQVDSSQTRAYEGSGLGMALAKELVELHKGKISVSSAEGKGTTFTVTIPLGKEHLNKDEISDSAYHLEAEKLSDIVLSAGIDSDVKEDESAALQPMLLIVEDNADMRRYIRKTLAEHYHIIEAENGKAGVKLAEETIPDLIISDIMMPEMDGYKLCELIKTNELTSHIPVILLTAKADRESKLTGLEYGADDYLSKPFDADELKLIVRNRIEERRRMRERFSKEITLEPKQISITSLDEKFLSKVLAIIEEHMEDEHFSIEELSREAGFSNMHFYRKIKGLSGQTPSQFLRTIRLKRAAELLAKNSDNVTQIAYSVGFSSLSYFNKCFKEQFGVTPGKFQT